MRLLRVLDSASLGRLSEPLLPAAAAGFAGVHSITLLRAIGDILIERECELAA